MALDGACVVQNLGDGDVQRETGKHVHLALAANDMAQVCPLVLHVSWWCGGPDGCGVLVRSSQDEFIPLAGVK